MTGCSENTSSVSELSASVSNSEAQLVAGTKMVRGVFEAELITNGKLEAYRKAELRFQLVEPIRKIFVKNGQRVNKGTLIAQVDQKIFVQQVRKAEEAFQLAELEFEDLLVRLGYQLADTSVIPSHTLRLAKSRSGLQTARANLVEARHRLSQARLVAPYPGVVANLQAQEYNFSSASDLFCTLIDDDKFTVSFHLLQSELDFVEKHQRVEVRTLGSDKLYSGKVTEINPIVNENGLISAKALINNLNRELMHGMNVEIVLKKSIPNQLIIPKSAVVLRDGKPVVFTMEGKFAQWNYVSVAKENREMLLIEKGLKEGQFVITEGNEFLAHKSPVRLEQVSE